MSGGTKSDAVAAVPGAIDRFPIARLITRLIIGGAQENAILSTERIGPEEGVFPTTLLCGSETGPEGSLWEDARKRGVEPRPVPDLIREVDPRRDWAAARWLRDRFEKHPYRIVHTHSSKAGILGRWAAQKAQIPRVVHTIHGWSFHEAQPAHVRRLYIHLERRAARWTDTLVAVSRRDIEKGLANGIGRPEQYRLIRSGVELQPFLAAGADRRAARAYAGLPQDVPVVGAVTRLSQQKAPLELVEVMSRVLTAEPTAWGLIVGDGPYRAEVRDRLRPFADRLILTGIRRDVAPFMAALDVFLLTSHWEGLPRTLPQAMAARAPIVAYDVDGVREAVAHERTGLVVPPGDVESAAEATLALIRNPDRRLRMAAAGPEMADEFSAERMIGELQALYQGLIAKRSSVNA